MTRLSPREALTVARIVRVNHAGEFGAIRIYSAQIAVAARRYPDVAPALADMLAHEKKHCAAFRAAMPERAFAAVPGDVAVELGRCAARLGHRADGAAGDLDLHRRGRGRRASPSRRPDAFPQRSATPALAEIILSIREEEEAHLHHAEERIANGTGAGSRCAASIRSRPMR